MRLETSMSERENQNRKLAGWLGYLAPTKEETEKCLAKRWYGLRKWTLHRHNYAPIENFSSYYWTPPDFFTSEDASAMLLEKMPHCHLIHQSDGEWWCAAEGNWPGIGGQSHDRKTAIALAALALIASEEK